MFSIPVLAGCRTHPRRRIPPSQSQTAFHLTSGVDVTGIRMTYNCGEEIYGDGECADMVYRIISGSVRCFNIRYDGRRQIEYFYFPGDILGLEARTVHHSSAEAICDKTSIVAIWRSTLEEIIATDVRASQYVLRLVGQEWQNSRYHALLLGRKHAAERMAGFLLEMVRLQAAISTVTLPMCRSDIADYLGLTIETVSRTLTQFERDGIIAMPSSRLIRLLNMDVLRSLSA